MQPTADYRELTDLLTLLCDGQFAQTDLERLERILLDDPEAQRYYARFLALDEELAWSVAGHSIASVAESHPANCADDLSEDARSADGASIRRHSLMSPLPTDLDAASPSAFPFADGRSAAQGVFGHFASGWPVAYLMATVIFAIGLAIGTIVHVSQPTSVVLPSPSGGHHEVVAVGGEGGHDSRSSSIVARITGMVDCVWEGPGVRVQGSEAANQKSEIRNHNSPLHLGDRLALRSGLLELTYDTGAKVILQGPVTYEVESATGGYLSIGKLTAKLEKRSAVSGQRSESANQNSEILSHKSPDLWPLASDLFAIRTPTAVVTDLGTEFGVEVDRSGATRSHVFRGSVKLEPITVNGGMPAESRILHANESAEVAKTGDPGSLTVQPMTVDPATFVRAGELPKLADDLRLKPSHRWQKYSEQLRKDSSLLAYYDFQLKQGEPSVLPNVAANGDKSFDGIVENATWTTGRMPGKHALLFNGPNDRVRVNLNRRLDNLTLVMWVCTYSVDDVQAGAGLLTSDGWGAPEQIHWQLNSAGQTLFVFGSGAWTAEGPTPRLDRLHRWMQFAAVYDGTAGKIQVYANGTLVGKVESPSHLPVCIGPAQIGCWDSTQFGTPGPTRNFHGRIDELVIFSRALGDDEVMRMYEEGRAEKDGDDARSSR